MQRIVEPARAQRGTSVLPQLADVVVRVIHIVRVVDLDGLVRPGECSRRDVGLHDEATIHAQRRVALAEPEVEAGPIIQLVDYRPRLAPIRRLAEGAPERGAILPPGGPRRSGAPTAAAGIATRDGMVPSGPGITSDSGGACSERPYTCADCLYFAGYLSASVETVSM